MAAASWAAIRAQIFSSPRRLTVSARTGHRRPSCPPVAGRTDRDRTGVADPHVGRADSTKATLESGAALSQWIGSASAWALPRESGPRYRSRDSSRESQRRTRRPPRWTRNRPDRPSSRSTAPARPRAPTRRARRSPPCPASPPQPYDLAHSGPPVPVVLNTTDHAERPYRSLVVPIIDPKPQRCPRRGPWHLAHEFADVSGTDDDELSDVDVSRPQRACAFGQRPVIDRGRVVRSSGAAASHWESGSGSSGRYRHGREE